MPIREDIILRLRGAAAAIRETQALAQAQRRLATTTKDYAKATEHANRRSFLYNQTLFTMRRYLYNATLAATALGTAAVYAGFRFNASVERTTIALDYLSKGQFDASEQTKEFLRIARETAFLPQQVIDIGQSFIAFGFTAEETNRTLRATADAIAALNLPPDAIHRILFALGQIRVKGKLYGEELRQLANANIPAYQYLEDALGKNVTQLNRIADAGIPAQVAIEAIVRGLEKQYGGASERIRETVTGQLEILKGDIQAILGGILLSLFNQFGVNLQRVTAVTGEMFTAVIEGNGGLYDMAAILDRSTGNAYHFTETIRTLHEFLSQLWGIVSIVVRAITPFVKIALAAAFAAIELATWIGRFINIADPVLIWLLRGIVTWMIAEIIVTKIAVTWSKRRVFWLQVEMFWLKRKIILLRMARFGYILYSGALIFATGVQTAFGISLAISVGLFYALIIVAVAVAAGLVYLYIRFDKLRWVIIALTLLWYPLLGVILLVHKNFGRISSAVQWLWDKMKGFANWLKENKDIFVNIIPGVAQARGAYGLFRRGMGLIGLQQGGAVTRGGMFRVGERGPEVVRLPQGAMVTPERMDWSGAPSQVNVTIQPQPILLDGKVITEAVYRHRLDRIARR